VPGRGRRGRFGGDALAKAAAKVANDRRHGRRIPAGIERRPQRRLEGGVEEADDGVAVGRGIAGLLERG
jgi:hypothetical protein